MHVLDLRIYVPNPTTLETKQRQAEGGFQKVQDTCNLLTCRWNQISIRHIGIKSTGFISSTCEKLIENVWKAETYTENIHMYMWKLIGQNLDHIQRSQSGVALQVASDVNGSRLPIGPRPDTLDAC